MNVTYLQLLSHKCVCAGMYPRPTSGGVALQFPWTLKYFILQRNSLTQEVDSLKELQVVPEAKEIYCVPPSPRINNKDCQTAESYSQISQATKSTL